MTVIQKRVYVDIVSNRFHSDSFKDRKLQEFRFVEVISICKFFPTIDQGLPRNLKFFAGSRTYADLRNFSKIKFQDEYCFKWVYCPLIYLRIQKEFWWLVTSFARLCRQILGFRSNGYPNRLSLFWFLKVCRSTPFEWYNWDSRLGLGFGRYPVRSTVHENQVYEVMRFPSAYFCLNEYPTTKSPIKIKSTAAK